MIDFNAVRDLEVSELPILPEGYTQLEYIRSNGSQPIDIGLRSSFDENITLAITFSVAAADSRYCLFGNYAADSEYAFSLEVYNTNQLRLYAGFYEERLDERVGFIEPNRKHTARFEWNAATRVYELYLDGVKLATGTCNISGIQQRSCRIFGDYRSGAEVTYSQPLTVYNLCYSNDVTAIGLGMLFPIARNLIPCRYDNPKYDEKLLGFYDLAMHEDLSYNYSEAIAISAGPTRKSGSVSKIEDASGRVLWITSALSTGLEFTSATAFTIEAPSPSWDGRMEYNNGSGWETWDGRAISSAYIDGSHALYLRGIGNTQVTSNAVGWTLNGADISCNGNIEKLLDYVAVIDGEHPTMASYCFSCMFKDCDSLITAPSLPATTLAEYCYAYMFYGCVNLTTVTALPATVLAEYCYAYMYYGCKKILVTMAMNSAYPTTYRIPMVGTGTTARSALTNMFTNTGGPLIATPSTPNVNTMYFLHTSNTIV